MNRSNPYPLGGVAWRWYLCWWLLLAAATTTLPGCSCREETPAEQAARKAAEEKERRERELAKSPWLMPLPTVHPGVLTTPTLSPKPGHWNGVTQPIRSAPKNEFDFDGEMELAMGEIGGDMIPLERTPYRLATKRPVVVARQSSKDIESWFYCPPAGKPMELRTTLRNRQGPSPAPSSSSVRSLLDHQYHFVVLAKEPERYAFLDSLYSVTCNLPTDADTTTASKGGTLSADKNYRVIALPTAATGRSLVLPDNPLAWTTIAYLLWDEVDPESLRIEQREAIIDWINWGGQLIVNGPDSLDLLKGSFLARYLPATSDGARELTSDDLRSFSNQWSATRRVGQSIQTANPWSGMQLNLNQQGAWLPGAVGLLAERRIGRGRIVVSGFQLAERDLVNWSAGVDNLYNAAILRRPPRRFVRDVYDDARPIALWTTKPNIALDPRRNTKLHYFARDLYKNPKHLQLLLSTEPVDTTTVPPLVSTVPGGFVGGQSDFQELRPPVVRGGVGAWSDENLVAQETRSAMRKSAGVSIPGAEFVIACLGAYLLLIGPLNWYLFSAIGRVELAWVAAPVISLAGAWVVVQQAQLDIGFVRSQTEIAILETQPDTTRGVLTRFNALYTSLSTTYELEFSDGMAFASPFPRFGRGEQKDKFDQLYTATYERQEKARLRGLFVSSNSSEFVRSEEVVDLTNYPAPGSSLPGGVTLVRSERGSTRLVNRTEWPLRHVAVVQRPDGVQGSAMLEGCWIGELAPGEATSVAFSRLLTPADDKPLFSEERSQADALLSDSTDRLAIEPLFALAFDVDRYEPGERRVIALIDQPLPGLTITPEASQQLGATIFIGHLGYGPLPMPAGDRNAPSDVSRER